MVSVEQERTLRLLEHADGRTRVLLAAAVERREGREHRGTVVGVATKLGVEEKFGESLCVLRRQLEPLEGSGEAAPQIVDPHQPDAVASTLGHCW